MRPEKFSRSAILLLFSAVLLFSCRMMYPFDEEIVFTIPEGAHYATGRFLTYISDNRTDFSFSFDESSEYDLGNSNQGDINKLFGFAEKSPVNIHRHSARFGWRWYNDSLQIHGYAYTDGTRKSLLLGTADIDTTYSAAIIAHEDRYEFIFEGISHFIERNGIFTSSRKYLSYPYFGGDETAPNEVRITLTFHSS